MIDATTTDDARSSAIDDKSAVNNTTDGTIDNDPRWWTELPKQIALVGSAVLFYFGVRGLTQGSEATAIENGEWLLELEERLGIAVEQSMQELTMESHALVTMSNWIYIWLHWPVIIVTLVWLHHSRRLDYLLLRNAMFFSGAIGLIIFATFPVAPPRLLNADFVDTVTDFSTSYRVLQPPALVNKYAAVPSLHVGWNLLIGIALFRASTSLPTWGRRAVRVFAVVGPTLMAIAVVTTANHYVLDAVAGIVVALAGLAIALKATVPIARLDYRLTHRDSVDPPAARSSTAHPPTGHTAPPPPTGRRSRCAHRPVDSQ